VVTPVIPPPMMAIDFIWGFQCKTHALSYLF